MNELINKALEYINSTEVFLRDQLPDFIQQYLTWCLAESIFYIVISLIPVIVCGISLLFISKKYGNKIDYDAYNTNSVIISHLVNCIMLVVFLIVSCVVIPINSKNILKIKVAPKVFLVEKLGELIKE